MKRFTDRLTEEGYFMKKLIAFIFAVIIMITICGCGNVTKANIMLTPSQRYSEKELTTAVNITKTYFMMNYDGCTLNYISYNDDVNEKNREDNLFRYLNPDRAGNIKDIVQFDVSYTDKDNTEKTVDYIVVRYENSGWEILDHGV